MKKVLLATTALTMSAGVAFAEVSISGFAEMGVSGTNSSETVFHQQIDVTFGMSAETSSGLTFGASVDLDEDASAVAAGQDAGVAVYVKGAFGNITLGDTDGGFDWALTEVGMGSALSDDHTSHAGYSGNSGLDGENNGQVARFDYSFGQVSVAASYDVDSAGTDDIMGFGVKYDAGVAKVGVGYQSNDADTIYGVSVSGETSGIQYAVNYSDLDTDGTHMALGLGYTMDSLMIAANYGVYESTAGVETTGTGLVANYDLGGGAVFQAGYGNGDGDTTWSAGMALSF
jgi:outer membrane protein OmpU